MGMAEYQKCKHCIDCKKNEIEETVVFCDIWGEWKNVTLGDCFGNCEAQEDMCDDRDQLIKVLSSQFGKHFSVGVADWLMENNVVPVVRCKDCKSAHIWKHAVTGQESISCLARYGLPSVKPDDFCSYGERR